MILKMPTTVSPKVIHLAYSYTGASLRRLPYDHNMVTILQLTYVSIFHVNQYSLCLRVYASRSHERPVCGNVGY